MLLSDNDMDIPDWGHLKHSPSWPQRAPEGHRTVQVLPKLHCKCHLPGTGLAFLCWVGAQVQPPQVVNFWLSRGPGEGEQDSILECHFP